MSVKYRCINREEGNYPVRSMCRWAKVSKSGYYAWRNRPKSSTARRREDLTAIIKVIFAESEQTYGYRRIHAELARNRTRVSRDTVRKIMAAEGLVACQPTKRAKTTTPAPDLPGRPDRLGRDFTATAPGMKWVGDITYIPTWQGFAYLAVVMDCFSRKIVGHTNRRSHAHRTRHPSPGYGPAKLPTNPRCHCLSLGPGSPRWVQLVVATP
ncbi:Integrase, catalytic core [Propionibacterium ruminifibrarum]|uniref:Integrase, catalytic core n=1 Tax=Propionibacterium ruminifibrarum TaxID=1962131 RepID=A0A375I1V0_9ACTN|nr:IS3 family transposase [Propionibacterium ruminifibrarum]SPF67125.1 Integrase, catalytic core [Propionibacterium ruminifibrarum]